MTVDFETMRAAGWSPLRSAAHAESQGMSRLEVYKAIFVHWGAGPFAADELLRHADGYPSRAARAAATIGLAALVLEYSTATCEDFAVFERTTGISGKVDALARADRPDEALQFYDRLDPRELRLTPTTESEARHVVLQIRATSSSLSSVVVDAVEQHPWGWLFSPQLTDGDVQRGPAPPGTGARPILFDRFTGVAIELNGTDPIADHIRRYEKSAWPFAL